MVSPIPLSDFRALRYKLDPDDFALSDGKPDAAPTNPVDEETWSGITHLPDDVAIRTSDHNGHRLQLLHSLWGDWIVACGDPEDADELFTCMLDACDAFQCTIFLYLHGYYRAAMSELRVAMESVMVGAYGNINPGDSKYLEWKDGTSELSFTRFRKRLHGILRKDQCKWLLEDGQLPDTTFRRLCDYTHSRSGSRDIDLWESNGPVYAHEAAMLVFMTALSVYAICYLLVKIARPSFELPTDSRILFEEDWVRGRESLAIAFEQLFHEPPKQLEPVEED